VPGGTGRQQVRILPWEGLGTFAGVNRRVVFGTLLGPETTGPWPGGRPLRGRAGGVWVLFVSGFLAAPIMRVSALAGCVCGVCGTGLLFENYIVDASIFYKKQFPRI
jgi:hypothetical protein